MRNITNADQQKFPGPRRVWERPDALGKRWVHHCPERGTLFMSEEHLAWGCYGCGGKPGRMRARGGPAANAEMTRLLSQAAWTATLSPHHYQEMRVELYEAGDERADATEIRAIVRHWRDVAKADLAATMQEGPS